VSEQKSVPVQNETVVIPNDKSVVEPVIRETVPEPTPMAAITPEPVLAEAPVEAPPPPVVEAPGVPDAPIVSKPALVERQATIHEVPVQARPATRPDYSWLAEALWNRVERMKRYPYLARMNRWEGKVVLEAVIRDDGHVLNLKVAQSSGYAVLDKDAMEVLQKASPLALKHPLGQTQVVVQVPISYRLER
jgi:protein TonB